VDSARLAEIRARLDEMLEREYRGPRLAPDEVYHYTTDVRDLLGALDDYASFVRGIEAGAGTLRSSLAQTRRELAARDAEIGRLHQALRDQVAATDRAIGAARAFVAAHGRLVAAVRALDGEGGDHA